MAVNRDVVSAEDGGNVESAVSDVAASGVESGMGGSVLKMLVVDSFSRRNARNSLPRRGVCSSLLVVGTVSVPCPSSV